MRGQLACPVLRGARVSNDPRLLDKAASLAVKDTAVQFAGKRFRVHELERIKALPIPEPVKTKSGKTRQPKPWLDSCFAQDACGDWWLCLVIEYKPEPITPKKEAAGIDLGLKDIAVASDGWRIEAPQFYRNAQFKLADLQRPKGCKKAGKKSRKGKRISRKHRQIARQRSDFTHKASAKTVKRYGKIFIGDVSSSKLAKTRMAKSVLDAAWSMYRGQVLHKSQKAGTRAEIINERYSTQTCSACGSICGPKGDLSVREWTCKDCGTPHDRDVNSAKICLARGNALVLEASGCKGAERPRTGEGALRAPITPNEESAAISGNRGASGVQGLAEPGTSPARGREALAVNARGAPDHRGV